PNRMECRAVLSQTTANCTRCGPLARGQPHAHLLLARSPHVWPCAHAPARRIHSLLAHVDPPRTGPHPPALVVALGCSGFARPLSALILRVMVRRSPNLGTCPHPTQLAQTALGLECSRGDPGVATTLVALCSAQTYPLCRRQSD